MPLRVPKKIHSGKYTKYDLQTENFDGYFELILSTMQPEQRNKIPDNLRTKLISQVDGKLRPSKLSFVEKVFILQRVFNRKWYIVIEGDGEEEAMSMEHFNKFRTQRIWNESLPSEANMMIRDGVHVIGERELIKWLFHLNDLCVSGAYNYGLKLRNVKPKNIFKEKKALNFFIKTLLTYEGNKRKIIRDYSIAILDFYCLLYLYDGKKKKAPELYEEVLLNAINVNKSSIMRSLKSLYDKKYIEKYGKEKDITYEITSFGINVINDILVKYVTPS